jgi:hypothetical protein
MTFKKPNSAFPIQHCQMSIQTSHTAKIWYKNTGIKHNYPPFNGEINNIFWLQIPYNRCPATDSATMLDKVAEIIRAGKQKLFRFEMPCSGNNCHNYAYYSREMAY